MGRRRQRVAGSQFDANGGSPSRRLLNQDAAYPLHLSNGRYSTDWHNHVA